MIRSSIWWNYAKLVEKLLRKQQKRLLHFDVFRHHMRVENVVADHLSRLTIAQHTHSSPIDDQFPEESLMQLENAPWYAHIANFLATGEIPTDWKE